MGDVIRIGKPAGFSKAVQLMSKEEVLEKNKALREQQMQADLAGSKFQLRQVIRHMNVVHGDGVTKCALLEVAAEYWPEG